MRKAAVFILSHGRAGRVYTVKTLRKCGYTGEIYIVLDDADKEIAAYQAEFGYDKCVIFSKDAMKGTFDIGDNGGNDKVVVYARNAMWKIAQDLGYRYFVVLDDDYTSFDFRYEGDGKLKKTTMRSLDEIFEASFQFLDDSGALTVCFAQAGDFIGGVNGGNFRKQIWRKAMNVWFMDTTKPFQFLGRINEDTTTYTVLGARGELFFTFAAATCVQKLTQTNKGGLTEIYTQEGTWLKSFYTVMMAPSCVKVAMMGDSHMRLHHNIRWNNAVPKILNECYKKKPEGGVEIAEC